MCKPTVLVVDDEQELLLSFRNLLEAEGYAVFTAHNEELALRYCQEEIIHVALIDVSLNDHAEENIGGIHLAAALDSSISKIMLTGQVFADPAGLIRRTLAPDDRGVTPATNFIWKNEGPRKVLEAIQLAFRKDIKLNHNLKITTTREISWHRLVNQVKQFRGNNNGVKRKAREVLRDLICRLFREADEAQIWRAIQGHGHCAVVLTRQVVDGVQGTDLAVKLGPRKSISREEENYRKYVKPHVPNCANLQLGPVWSREMGAIAYSFVGEKERSVKTFLDHYNDNQVSIDQVKDTLSSLFEGCKNWYDGKRRLSSEIKQEPLDISYRRDLNLLDERHVVRLKRRFNRLLHEKAPGNVTVQTLDDGQLRFQIGERSRLNLPNPVKFALEERSSKAGSDFFPPLSFAAITHGDLHSRNIVVGKAGGAWMIDFFKTGWGPVLRDFVELESDIKFTLLRSGSLRDRYEMERAMIEKPRSLNEAFEAQFKSSPLQGRALDAVQRVRELACRLTGADGAHEYFIGLLFFALKRIVGFTSANDDEPAGDIGRYHALLSAAMICERLRRDACDARGLSEIIKFC